MKEEEKKTKTKKKRKEHIIIIIIIIIYFSLEQSDSITVNCTMSTRKKGRTEERK